MRRRGSEKRLASILSWLWVVTGSACNVAPPPSSTGGAMFGEKDAGTDSEAGPAPLDDAGDGLPDAPACGRGVVIVESDFRSTNIVVSRSDGTTLSESFVSSGATKPGLSLALSGDVDVPFVAPRSKRLVLLDRFGTNVVTWMNVESATALAQLPIGQGFESNPHDYIEVDATRAFVSRYGSNVTPGALPFDTGGDLLILDTTILSILGHITMPEDDPRLLPCPGGMTWLDDEVVVTLERWSRGFDLVGDGRFVGVSPRNDSISWIVDVPGLSACGRAAVSSDQKRLAIACSGKFDFDSKRFDTARSDIVLFDATQRPPVELKRFQVAARLDAGVEPALVFARENLLFGTTYGGNATPGDGAFTLDIESGEVTALFQASKAVVLGGLRCSPGCENVCLLSDAEVNRLHRWSVPARGPFERLGDAVLESIVGLPPRNIGGL